MTKIIGLGVAGLVLVGLFAFLNYSKENPIIPVEENTYVPIPGINTPTDSGVSVTPPAYPPAPTSYTLAQVSTHKSKSDCWSAINGSLYDLTSWIGQHPGGQQAIMSICGKDGSKAFNAQHGDAAKQATILFTFKIGVLKN